MVRGVPGDEQKTAPRVMAISNELSAYERQGAPTNSASRSATVRYLPSRTVALHGKPGDKVDPLNRKVIRQKSIRCLDVVVHGDEGEALRVRGIRLARRGLKARYRTCPALR